MNPRDKPLTPRTVTVVNSLKYNAGSLIPAGFLVPSSGLPFLHSLPGRNLFMKEVYQMEERLKRLQIRRIAKNLKNMLGKWNARMLGKDLIVLTEDRQGCKTPKKQ
jgi:hypothetical protein